MTGALPIDAPGRSATRILADTAQLLEVSEQADRRIGRALELLSVVVPYERCVLFEARPDRPQRLVVVPDSAPEERGLLTARAGRLLALLAEHHERGLPAEEHAAPVSARGGAASTARRIRRGASSRWRIPTSSPPAGTPPSRPTRSQTAS